MVICLGRPSPAASSSLPAAHRCRCWSVWVTPRRLFGLAPTGGYRATVRCRRCGGLLPHRFTLTPCVAVCFLWPGPSPCSAQALPGSLPGGARTFLERLTTPATIALDPPEIY